MNKNSNASVSESVLSEFDEYDRYRAGLWSLSEEEWLRYQSLMDGIRGAISPPTISPVEVLGIHARDDTERHYYAELWARMYREDTQRVLAFQREYDAAQARLSAKTPVIDMSRLPISKADAMDLKEGDRVIFFTDLGCADCRTLLSHLLNTLKTLKSIRLDIYVLSEEQDDNAIRSWAEKNGVPFEAVERRRITLNHDNGTLVHMTGSLKALPFVLRKRGSEYVVLTDKLAVR